MNAFRNLPDSILCGPEHASGVILGTLRGRKIVDTSMAPSVVLGPCGSGKGASVLTPSLLTWRGSAVVVEPAGELRDLTAAWRRDQAANRIFHLRFDGWESSDTFNLLDGIRRDTPDEAGDIAAIADEIVPEGDGDAPMTELARVAVALAIVAVRHNGQASMADVHSALLAESLGQLVGDEGNHGLEANPELSAWARALRTSLGTVSGEELVAARKIAIVAAAIFVAPDVQAKTATSTFRLQDLRQEGEAATLYLTCAPLQKHRLRTVQAAFLRLVTRHATQAAGEPRPPMLMLLDDFSSLGRLRFLAEAMPALDDSGVKLLLAVSRLQDLLDTYGPDTKVWERCTTKVILPLNTVLEAELAIAWLYSRHYKGRRLNPDFLGFPDLSVWDCTERLVDHWAQNRIFLLPSRRRLA